MIVLDIETTGLSPLVNSMVSLGAVDYVTGEEFYGECRIHPDTQINQTALDINGFTVEQVTDRSKVLPVVLYLNFLNWSTKFDNKLLAGHNIGHFDILFLEYYHAHLNKIYGPQNWPFGYRTLDLHSVAFIVLGKSLNHEGICTELGLPIEPKPHNALVGARSERDAFRKLLIK